MPPLDIVTVTAYVPQGYIIATAVALPDDEQPKHRNRKLNVNSASSILCWASEGDFVESDDAGGVGYTYINMPLVEATA